MSPRKRCVSKNSSRAERSCTVSSHRIPPPRSADALRRGWKRPPAAYTAKQQPATPARISSPFSKKSLPVPGPPTDSHHPRQSLRPQNSVGSAVPCKQQPGALPTSRPHILRGSIRRELWLGKIERDLLARGVFTPVTDLAGKIRCYIRAPNRRIRSNELTATGRFSTMGPHCDWRCRSSIRRGKQSMQTREWRTEGTRLRLFDKLLGSLVDMNDSAPKLRRNALGLLAGYLATVAAGGAPSLALAEEHAQELPELLRGHTRSGASEKMSYGLQVLMVWEDW
jgi:hypothetical protein